VVYNPKLCSIFTGCEHPLEVRDVMIASHVLGYSETSKAYKIHIPT
jgi:hypothetical protein